MAERQGREIVEFHLGAFNTQVAMVTAYDTKDTPRKPVERFYAEHRAYAHYGEAQEHRIYMGDSRLNALGLTALEHALNEEDARAVAALDQLHELKESATDTATA